MAGQPFPEEATPGGVLVYPQIQSPNYVPGVSGWSINQNGTAQFNELTLLVQTSGQAVLIYAGTAASGTLIGSWASVAGIDAYGNSYPAGIYASSGFLSGLNITGSSVIASTLVGCILSGPSVTAAAIQGGTMTETSITFDGTGGRLLVYTSSTTTATITSGSTWTAPAGNYSQGKVECYGGDAGGSGGNGTYGGEAGGGAAYSCEPNYPLVPGQVYNIAIGAAGSGGQTGNAGTSGGQTAFDNQGVVAYGGQAGSSFVGGLGGQASTNTISHPGGNGGNGGLGTASAGGGGRAGSTGPGGNGGNGGSTPGAAGAAGTGTGGLAGGAGVAAATNGNNGGGGSGAGKGGTGTTYQSLYYDPTGTHSYYGAATGGALRNTNGSMFQGDPDVPLSEYPGDQFSYANYNTTQMYLDWYGWTIDQVVLSVNNQHSWYGSGCYLILSYSTSGGDTYTGDYYWTDEGVTSVIDVTSPLASHVGTFTSIKFGPSALSGNAYSLYNYGYYQGGAGVGGPRLTVNGHQGSSGSYKGGNGSAGQIKVTYVSSSSMVAAIAPVAGTDASGNAFAAGYTGPTQAFQPSSSPAVVETWHNVTPPSGWTGTLRYKAIAEHNLVYVDWELYDSSGGSGNVVIMTLPTQYRFSGAQRDYAASFQGSGAASLGARVFIKNDGTVTTYGMPTGTTYTSGFIIYPLD